MLNEWYAHFTKFWLINVLKKLFSEIFYKISRHSTIKFADIQLVVDFSLYPYFSHSLLTHKYIIFNTYIYYDILQL